MKRLIIFACILFFVSDAFALSVQITTPEDGQTVNTLKVLLNATISGGTPPYRILWFSDVDGRIFPTPHVTPEFTFSFPTLGRHRMTIDVMDSAGAAAKDTVTMTVKPALYARIASPESGTVYGGVKFEADVSGTPPYEIAWSSDRDGILGYSENFSRQLSKGKHTISLRVVDFTSAVAEDTKLIDVRYSPEAKIVSPAEGIFYGQVVFGCVVSGGDPPYKITWSSSIDGVLGDTENFSRKLSLGEHVISLRVTDAMNAVAKAERKITLRDPLTAKILLPKEGTYRGVIGFSANYSGGNPPYDIIWLSSLDGFIGGGERVEKELDEGKHDITLRVVDSDGVVAEDHLSLDILPQSYMQYAIIVLVIVICVFIIIRVRGGRR